MAKRTHDISERDRKLLAFVGQYRLGTDDLFRRVFFPDVTDPRAYRLVGESIRRRSCCRGRAAQ